MSANDLRSRYVLVIPVPRDVEIRIEDRFLGLSGATKPMMGYHITLLGSFMLPEAVAPRSLANIAPTCSAIEPFEISIGGTGAFEVPGNHTIYIPVQETAPIMALQRALWQALEAQVVFASEGTRAWNLPDSFHPHITLGLGLSDDEYRAFQRSGAEQGCSASFAATHIDLITQIADGPWQCLASYALGHQPAEQSSEATY